MLPSNLLYVIPLNNWITSNLLLLSLQRHHTIPLAHWTASTLQNSTFTSTQTLSRVNKSLRRSFLIVDQRQFCTIFSLLLILVRWVRADTLCPLAFSSIRLIGHKGGSSPKLKEGQPENRVPKDDREKALRRHAKIFWTPDWENSLIFVINHVLTCTFALHFDRKS